MASKRTCVCCNEKYDFCPSCGADKLLPSWRATFCSGTCKDLWYTLTKYNMHLIEKSEAVDKINLLNLKPIKDYVTCVQRDYEIVMRPEETEIEIIEEVVVDEVVVPEPVVIHKSKSKSKSHGVVETIE